MQNKLIIFSAPSGAGKTTIVRALLKMDLNIEFSISACSRKPRKNEIDGQDYFFLSVDEFKRRIQNDEFLEWEEVYKDNYYGTLKSEIDRIGKKGNAVIFDVDVVGGLNIKKQYGKSAKAFFIQAPSVEVLEQRLRARATDDESSIMRRVKKAKKENEYASMFDTVIVNDNLEEAINTTFIELKKFLEKTNADS